MVFVIVGICLFVGFGFLFLLLTPRPSAAGALLQEVTRPMRQVDVPAWRSAMDVDILARPFTLIRSLFSPEPDPKLVRRLMLANRLPLPSYIRSDGVQMVPRDLLDGWFGLSRDLPRSWTWTRPRNCSSGPGVEDKPPRFERRVP